MPQKVLTKKFILNSFSENQENLVAERDRITADLVKVNANSLGELNESVNGNNNNNITKENVQSIDDSKDEGKLVLTGKIQIKKEEDLLENSKNSETKTTSTTITTPTKEEKSLHDNSVSVLEDDKNIPIDWEPQKQCYFCVDGKLLTVNEKGELVAESGSSAHTEADVANHVRFFFDHKFLILTFYIY